MTDLNDSDAVLTCAAKLEQRPRYSSVVVPLASALVARREAYFTMLESPGDLLDELDDLSVRIGAAVS